MKINFDKMKPALSREGGIGFSVDVRDLESITHPSVAMVREAILEGFVAGSDFVQAPLPMEAMMYIASSAEIEMTGELAEQAVRAGRMIDFGHWPNEAIMNAARRAGPMWNAGALPMPFYEPWLMMHSWEGGACVYLIAQTDPKVPNSPTEITELQCLRAAGHVTLMIGDRGLIMLNPESDDKNRYYVMPVPSVWRFMPGAHEITNQGRLPELCVAGNIIDPLMTALMMLNTLNVKREKVTVKPSLNKARALKGKHPIPPYEVVNSRDYVTVLMPRAPRPRGEDHGGTHASPLPHSRRAHLRTLASGRLKLIGDTLVRVPEDVRRAYKERMARSHYELRQP